MVVHYCKRLFQLLTIIAVQISCAGAAIQHPTTSLKMGIDNLAETDFALLRGKRVALLVNSASRASSQTPTPELFRKTTACNLTTLLTPEHGYYATVAAGETVPDDSLFGVPVYSLYGKHRRPNERMLSNADVVVADIQDIGVRSYTFVSTLFNVMSACAEYNKPLYVLDRPNPLGGTLIDGNVADQSLLSFVSIVPVPYLHGCTIGELASIVNNEGWLPKDSEGKNRKCSLTVVKMKRWTRDMTWEQTGLPWYPTSPNIPTLSAVRGAAMTGIIGELSVVSIGIGTTLPFQYLGLPDMNAETFYAELSNSIPAQWIHPTKFCPTFGKGAKKNCNGIILLPPAVQDVPYFSLGMDLLIALHKLYPSLFSSVQNANKEMFKKVTAHPRIFDMLIAEEYDALRATMRSGREKYLALREKYLIYE